MLKKILLAATATVAFAGPASAASIVVSDINTVEGVAPLNNFAGQLAGEGFTLFTKDYGSVSVVGSSRIEVYRVASESGYLNTLSAFGSGPISEPGPQPVSGWTPNDLVASTPLFSGDLSGAINFFSNGAGDPLTFNSFQVGIFLPTGFQGSSYQTQHLWVGFDDSRYIDPNDNHDDYIIRISAVPEPATWLTMIAGFGLVGYQLRRRGAKMASAVA